MTKTTFPATLRTDTPYSASLASVDPASTDVSFGGISFLHTAPGHVAIFGSLMTRLAPEIPVRHEVADAALATARHQQKLPLELTNRAAKTLTGLAERGARVVVCTCPTLSAYADHLESFSGSAVLQRADRAAAAQAYQAASENGGTLHVVACVKDTFAPTLELLSDIEDEYRANVALSPLLLPEPWALFNDGLRRDFRQAIADALQLLLPPGSVILLTQASMAGAANLLPANDYRVFSSPLPGTQAAISAWRQMALSH